MTHIQTSHSFSPLSLLKSSPYRNLMLEELRCLLSLLFSQPAIGKCPGIFTNTRPSTSAERLMLYISLNFPISILSFPMPTLISSSTLSAQHSASHPVIAFQCISSSVTENRCLPKGFLKVVFFFFPPTHSGLNTYQIIFAAFHPCYTPNTNVEGVLDLI